VKKLFFCRSCSSRVYMPCHHSSIQNLVL